MVLGKRFVLKHHFDGMPKPEDFDLVQEKLPPLKEGEILIESLYLTVWHSVATYSIKSLYYLRKIIFCKTEFSMCYLASDNLSSD